MGLDNAEVVILACRHPEKVGIEAELGRQLYGVGPYCIEPGTVKRSDSAFGGGRLVVLEHCYEGPCRMPAADDGACSQLDAELVVILPAVDGTHQADKGIF